MTRGKKILAGVLVVMVLVIGGVAAYGWGLSMYYKGCARGATKAEVNHAGEEAALLLKLKQLPAEERGMVAQEYLERFLRLRWDSIQSHVTRLELDIPAYAELGDVVEKALGSAETPEN